MLFIVHVSWFMILVTAPAIAATVSNQNYSLEMQHIIPGTPENEAKTEAQPPADNLPPLFVFSPPQTFVDFGKLSATNPITRTNTIDIIPGPANGYSLQAFENNELTS